MTLSHCWGLAECLKLTTDNYTRLLDGIPTSTLPQLYQDAVYIVRHMSVRYLWIDSLCIIQQGDDGADWEREVAIMDKVYTHSFCNISASNAPNSDHTLFCSRNPDAIRPPIIDFDVGNEVAPYILFDCRVWETGISNSLINTRAWVFQERLLSPRILHFGDPQLLWECHEHNAAEIYPEGLPRHVKDPTPFKDLINARREQGSNLYSWDKIVKAYTACNLTFPSDKFAALSAIAKRMRHNLQDEYVAGMWRCSLEHELLWKVSTPQSSQENAYRAPSWSWMSADGEVVPGRLSRTVSEQLFTVENLELEYITNDNTLAIRSGKIQLRGVLKQLTLLPPSNRFTNAFDDWEIAINGVRITACKTPNPQSTAYVAVPDVSLDCCGEEFDNKITHSRLFCMPGQIEKGKNGSIYILLLELYDPGNKIFRRIGLARESREDVKKGILARRGNEDKLPCSEYRDGYHSIRII